jgi:hypothetical protein
MRYHSEPLGKRTEPVSYFQEGGNHAEQQCLSHMKESKQPDGPQVVDPKADRAQKMPIASHKEDSLRPKEKTTSEEFKDVAEEQSIVLTGNVHQPDTKLIDQEAKHQSRRENKGALSFERKEKAASITKREAKSGTLPRGLKLGQPEQGGLLATAKGRRLSTSESVRQQAESLTQPEARDLDKPVGRERSSTLSNDSKVCQYFVLSKLHLPCKIYLYTQ